MKWLQGIAVSVMVLVAVPGCSSKKKKDDAEPAPVATAPAVTPPPAAPPPAAPPPVDPAAAQTAPGPAPSAPLTGNEVKRYPDETPVGNATVRAVVPFNVYRETDLISEKLGGIAQGTFVNVIATRANWILVMWPSGVGELSPGWAPIPNINDRRLALIKAEDPRWNAENREPIEDPRNPRDKKRPNRIRVKPRKDR